MLDKEKFKEGIETLVALFPTWNIDCTNPKTMSIWYEQFKKFDDISFSEAIKDYCKYERFNPTVCGILEYTKSERRVI